MMEVDTFGSAKIVENLNAFDKQALLILKREIKAAAELIAVDARSRVYFDKVLSNWGPWTAASGRDLSFSAGAVKAGIKSSYRSKREFNVTRIYGRVTDTTAAGAIFELAGSTNNKGNRNGDRAEKALYWFIRNIEEKRGVETRWPRLLTPARDKEGPKAHEAIRAAIAKAADRVTEMRGR